LQDCKEFHQAKDGDGWVEQSFQPVLFGMLQKVNAKLFEPLILLFKNLTSFQEIKWCICAPLLEQLYASNIKPRNHKVVTDMVWFVLFCSLIYLMHMFVQKATYLMSLSGSTVRWFRFSQKKFRSVHYFLHKHLLVLHEGSSFLLCYPCF